MRPIQFALLGLVLNLALLLPGILQPVLTVVGQLEPAGIAHVAPTLLETGVSDEAIKSFKPLLNPLITKVMGSDENLKKEMLKKLSPQIIASLSASTQQIEVYRRSRSILETVQHLYSVGSGLAATLILLFSVLVPFGKIAMALGAVLQRSADRRTRLVSWLGALAKWSMADVFAVALLITFLAAQASQTPNGPDHPPALVSFAAQFGPGFYWFTAYCLVSIITHQVAVKFLPKE